MERVQVIITANLSKAAFNIDELCLELQMEKIKLHRQMIAANMPPPATIIRYMRLEAARSLIRSDFGNVSQIMYEVGFNNLSTFSNAFKKHFGVTPNEMISLWVNYKRTE